jgi:hypothetical protein
MTDPKALDVHRIRYDNFRQLFEQFKARPEELELTDYGRVRRFADHIGWSQRYVAGLLRQDKSIGTNFCRELEKRLTLPHGFMDLPYSAANRIDVACESEAEKAFAETSLALFRAFPDAQRRLIEVVQKEIFKDNALKDAKTAVRASRNAKVRA